MATSSEWRIILNLFKFPLSSVFYLIIPECSLHLGPVMGRFTLAMTAAGVTEQREFAHLGLAEPNTEH